MISQKYSDHKASHFPVSIKSVIYLNRKVILLKNERDEWELPGGKLEPGESPESCVVREAFEELSISVEVDSIIDSWLYVVSPNVEVVIITYLCKTVGKNRSPTVSHEHKEVKLFSIQEVPGLFMPDGYKRSIANSYRAIKC
ncbi:MAG: NUDIX hydrolase [Rhodospirillaceae bacterium]|nr:NUDIX hydrolase [Rhodospirillaceae bacterium]